MYYNTYNFPNLNLNQYDLTPAYDKKEAKSTFSRLFLALIIFSVVASLVLTVLEFVIMFLFGNEAAATLLSNTSVLLILQVIAMYVIAFPIFLIITKDLTRRTRPDYLDRGAYGYSDYYAALEKKGKEEELGFGGFIGLFFICAFFMLSGSYLSRAITTAVSEHLGFTVGDFTSDLMLGSDILTVLIVAVIIGPIIEEIIFRKVFIDVIGVYGTRLALISSSIAFGFFHGNLSQLIYTTFMGFVFGYIYTKTNRIGLSILMHILVNFYGTIPALLVEESYTRIVNLEETTLDLISVYAVSFMQFAFAVIGLILLIRAIVKKRYPIIGECEIEIPKRNFLRVTFFNFGVIFFYLYCIATIFLSIIVYY